MIMYAVAVKGWELQVWRYGFLRYVAFFGLAGQPE